MSRVQPALSLPSGSFTQTGPDGGPRAISRRQARTFAFSVAVLLLAAGLRLWGLAELPPGLHHDEAFHLLQAQQIAAGQALPVYITGNQGNEPLYAYLASIGIRILGPVNWAGRLVAAWVGLLAVALTMRAGNEMFPGRGVGAAAGLVLAGWYWPLAMSRWGSQPILSAAASAGAMAGLWRGMRTDSRWAYALTGVSLAAGLWAYAVFRLFPVVVVAAVVAVWLVRKPQRHQLAAGALLAVLVAAVLYSPLGLFFLKNPQWFFNRYSQVTQVGGGPSTVARLLDNTRLELAGWVVPGAGDHDWRQNLPGRPALDLVQLGLFAAGLVWLARRRRGWPQALTLLAWFAVGLSISVLTEFPPQSGRSVMATPAGALIMGAGLAGLWRWAGQERFGLVSTARRGVQLPAHLPPRTSARDLAQAHVNAPTGAVGLASAGKHGLLTAALALSLASTVSDYFIRWASSGELYTAFDTDLVWIGSQLRNAAPGTQLIETPVDRSYPTLEYSLGPEPFARFESFNGRECFLAPAVATSTTDYAVIIAEDTATVPSLLAAFPGTRQRAVAAPGGTPYAVVYEVPAGAQLQTGPVHPQDVLYGSTLRLLGDDLAKAQAVPGTVLRVPLFWRLEQPTSADLKRFVHVIGPAKADGSTIYAQHDSSPCDNSVPTWQWKPGEIMIETVKVDLPADLPRGTYQVFTGWYDVASLQRLTAMDASGKELGDTVPLGTVQVAAGAARN